MYYLKRTFIIFCIIFLILELSVSMYVLTTAVGNFKSISSSSATQIEANLSALFDDAESSAQFISGLKSTISFLYSKTVIPPTTNLSKNISTLNELMSGTVFSSSHLDSIYLYSLINDFVLATRQSSTADKFYDKTFLEYYKSTGEVNFVLPNKINIPSKSSVDVISCAFGIYDVNIPIGIVVFNIKRDRICDIISTSGLDFHYFNIYNPSGEEIFSLNENSPKNTGCNYSLCFSDRSILLAHNISTKNMNLNFGIETLHYGNIALYVFVSLLLCFMLIVTFSAISSIYISSNFYSSVQNIIMLLQNADNTENDEIYDDMQFIADNIVKYIRDKENLTHRLTTQIAQYKRLQSYTLQLQFNPHFLFNTLNIANLEMYKISRRHTPANTVISCLADLLEISLDEKKSIVTFSEEISYAQKYLSIQSICDDTFDVILNISPDVANVKVPKLILQPILENAMTHGIKYLMHKKRGEIKISAAIDNQFLCISIYDNGKGMSPEQLDNIRNQLKNNDIPSSNHIGLCNVFQRLKLIFDTECDLTIDSTESDGTSVKIKLPVEYDNH